MMTWTVIACAATVMVTIGLFISGALYPRPVVSRMQLAHDAEMRRILEAHQADMSGVRQDADYFRQAAQSCATAVSHREAQVRALQALLERCQKGP